MLKHKSANFHTIPVMKGYVKGYYERRNGRLVWVNPYQNSKDKHPGDPSKKVTNVVTAGGPKLPKFDPKKTRATAPAITVRQTNNDEVDFVVEIITRMVHTIDNFDQGEIVKLRQALATAKSIVRELGYLDQGIAVAFEIPNGVKQTRLGAKAARETAAMSKQLKKLSNRVSRSTIRQKIQKMSDAMDGAL